MSMTFLFSPTIQTTGRSTGLMFK